MFEDFTRALADAALGRDTVLEDEVVAVVDRPLAERAAEQAGWPAETEAERGSRGSGLAVVHPLEWRVRIS